MTAKAPGHRRVEAWVYGVINPLEEALEREVFDAERRVPSYRWRTASLEGLLPLRRYLPRAGVLIMEDLASYFPRVLELEHAHDARLSELTAEAKRVFEALLRDQRFVAVARGHFASVCAPDTLLTEVAQDLVNDDPEVVTAPSGSYRAAWNRALPELRKLREEAGYAALSAALESLRTGSDGMRDELVALRTRLVEEFDVPPAPLYA